MTSAEPTPTGEPATPTEAPAGTPLDEDGVVGYLSNLGTRERNAILTRVETAATTRTADDQAQQQLARRFGKDYAAQVFARRNTGGALR